MLGSLPAATAASSPSRSPPLIAPPRAYKRFCFVSHIIPVISPVPTDKVKVFAETTRVFVNIWWCHGRHWLFVCCKRKGWSLPVCQSQQLSQLCCGLFEQHKSQRQIKRKITQSRHFTPSLIEHPCFLVKKKILSGPCGIKAIKEVHVWPSFTLFVSLRPKAMLWAIMVDWHNERKTFTDTES